MKRFLFILTGLMISLLAGAGEKVNTSEERVLYEEALREYQDNNFQEALNIFEKIIASGYSSYKLYYNTGNAAFKTDNIPSAIPLWRAR